MSQASCDLCASRLRSWRRNPAFYQCSRCGFTVRTELPAECELNRLYESSWAAPDERSSETGSTDLLLARQYALSIAQSVGRSDLKGQQLLDYGAGKGALSLALGDLGATVFAVEPYGYSYLKQRGHRVFRDLAELPEGTKFDGIVAMEVVEHLEQPWTGLAALRSFLKGRGWLLITTPNVYGLNARLSGPQWREAQKPGHLMFFAPRSMGLLLERAGFRSHRRLSWEIRYGPGGIRGWKDVCLRRAGLDGSLRFLAD